MENTQTYGFGIIGLGSIAITHAQAINQAKGCTLVAGYHANKDRAERFCKEHGGKAYSDLNAFLSDPRLDVVVVATPSGMHLEAAIAAISSNKHVIIEKPLEVTVARCDQIIDLARQHAVKIGGIFQSRYYGASQTLKKAIDEGRFGKITLMDAQFKWFRSQEYYDSASWRGTWQYDGGGVFMNQGIHAIDLLQWFGGPVVEVNGTIATLAHERIEVEDTAVATLRFASGALGIIEGTTGSYPGFLKRIEVCGTKGSAILEEDSFLAWQFLEEREEDADIRRIFGKDNASTIDASKPSGLDPSGHRAVFEQFSKALRTGTALDLPGEEAKKPVEIIEAIYKSAREKTSVLL
ncbi:putative dehydrogenase [Sphaerochaeta pleomorpha str. Grapes]|uniref:Putative dehydrogenase n=1 Tax=Sphaerochaeta pleomorpha (strain ATCC BAA-1885 / DSM 22778 / Grapes) TaxID=158190 RepID=G8QXU7_SPHPG|nr:Gfo/Idh/MocA family oxidoreductase [Sphaerochaeta pleomorpha]AEV30741.1 putative dehydrogenase [Sphaerochaeta pleomorpha str. Grapes]